MKLFDRKELKANLDDISNQIKNILPKLENHLKSFRQIDLEGIVDLKSFSQIDLEGIVGIYSPQIDKIIKETEKEYSCRFGAGRFFISVIDDESFTLRTEIYFVDKDKKFYACKSESSPQQIKNLTDNAKAELMEKQEVSFDINPPE